ncbi:uridine kinase [Gilvimarinus chinensis]|uniref:uridine kinase n=1 Tax=Gilvimarinus chinensis TaxID=396005 RepID=UPI000382A5CB|nr:uridine kinase [Gilvimarinus chinensis]
MTFWLLTIAGVSASGKTTLKEYLAHELHQHFGFQPTCLAMDGYYCDFSALPPSELKEVNYDHPDSFDSISLVNDVRRLKSGEPIYSRDYNYVQHKPVEAATQTYPAPIIILEGILPLHFSEILTLSDLTVYLDTPIDRCFERRLCRDVQERGRSMASVKRQFETHVLPMYSDYVQPQKQVADQVLADGGQCPVLLENIIQRVEQCRG